MNQRLVKYDYLSILLIGAGLTLGCGGDSGEPDPTPDPQPTPDPTAVGTASAVSATDAGDVGNAGDIRVSFSRASDESGIAEYRIVIVKNSSNTPSVDAAAALVSERYLTILPGSGQVTQRIIPTQKDSDGNDIQNGSTYSAIILSVANGTSATINAISAPSPTVDLNTRAPTVSSLFFDDLTNRGDASDFEISFRTSALENLVQEYRVVLVPSANAPLNNQTAVTVPATGYTVIEPTGNDVLVRLDPAATDSDGNPLSVGTEYFAQVISIGAGIANLNAVSSPSNSSEFSDKTVKITYLGNDGVLIADSLNRVIVDGLPGNLSGWVAIPVGVASSVNTGTHPYGGIDLVLITHNHGDHVNTTTVNAFLANNPNAMVIGPPQIVGGITSNRVIPISPAFQQKADTTVNGVFVEVLHLRHFNQFGMDFSTTQNFGYVIHLGGKKIVHLGDVDYADDNFQNFSLDQQNIDAVLIPTFNTLINAANRTVIVDNINPGSVIGLHLRPAQFTTEIAAVMSTYPGANLFTVPLQVLRY